MLVSKDFATHTGFDIDTSEASRTSIMLADGTLKKTAGLVHEVSWSFDTGGEGRTYHDFHVVDDLQFDVVLSEGFFYDNDVFSNHGQCFDGWMEAAQAMPYFCLFRLLGLIQDAVLRLLRKCGGRKRENCKRSIATADFASALAI